MDGGLIVAVGMALAGYDPLVDQELAPKEAFSVGFGVQRLQDDFGLALSVVSPYVADGHLALRLEGGIGWASDLRALPVDAEEQVAGAWSMYGHVRLLGVAATRLGLASGRLYVALGPSLLVLDRQLSSERVSPGVVGVFGTEFFAADAYRAFPVSLFFEVGGTAHTASADIENRIGEPEPSGTTVDRPVATGLALSAGLRFYL
ncbi:MAG TPA: hypothetical protein RMG48_21575 [Myxococcales bacterium LLY-WYZ-16_1]|nr:hypothetical protein [Myxococcales bacterium LLY-WYZ-16_1]